jgi:hypothetical protein
VAPVKNFTAEEKGEIWTSYRQAARKSAQIGILSQLYACTTADIRRVLRLTAPPETERRTPVSWSDAMTERLLVLADGSYTAEEIGAELGVPQESVRSRVQRLRARGYVLAFRGSPPQGEGAK